VRKRFEDVGKFHTEYLSMKMYNPGMYFDGLSMRLIFVRFGLEIFREQGNYLLGVGTGDAEHLLKEKIKAYNMYQGDGVKDKAGYLQFGFHNQLLQKLLQLGLLGFAVFLATIVYCFAMAIKYKDGFLLNLILIFTLTFFTDTLLEHQVGLVMFLSFACMAINTIRQRIKKNLALEQ
jgi:O-antigen ligase